MIKKPILITLLLLGVVAPATVGTQIYNNISKSSSVVNSEVSLEEVYSYGYKLEVPTLVKDGVTYESTVEYPDGNSTHLTSVNLNQVGTYTVHYTAVKDGKYLSEDHSFIVKNTNFSFTGDSSFAVYEKSERSYNKEGLYVALAPGEKFTYNKIIDLNSLNSGEKLIDVFAAPTNVGSMDFGILYFTLTDIEDPDQSLRIRAKATGDGVDYPWTYISAGGPNQSLTGKEGSNIHVANDFGTPICHSFYGYYNPAQCGVTTCGEQSIKLSYEAGEKMLYANNNLVCDFDDKEFFPTLWDGFPSGKATLTIEATTYIGDYAKFHITELANFDLSQLVLEDNEAPVITVDLPSGTLPKGRTGYTYPIFDATAKDNVTKDLTIKTTVLYRYDTDKYVHVEHDDYSFATPREGVYRILYEASDIVGNVGQQYVDITVVDESNPVIVSPKGTPVKEALRGNYYYFPEFIATGGNGELTTSYRVTFKGGEVSLEKDYFIPHEVGNYIVYCYAEDMIGQKDFYSYTLTVNENYGQIFYSKPELPKYFVSDYRYLLPELYAVDFGMGDSYQLADVAMTYGDSTQSGKSGEYFTPTVENSGDIVTVRYSYKEVELVYEIPCIKSYENGRLTLKNYFITNNLNINTDTVNQFDMTTIDNGNGSWEFANYIVSNEASIEFKTLGAKVRFDSLNVTFTDKNNEEEAFTVRFEGSSDNKILAYVGKKVIKIDGSFSTKDSVVLTSYNENFITVNGASFPVETYDNGEKFEGFSSGYVYLSCEMVNARAGDGIAISRIDNQMISMFAHDFISPRINISGVIGGYYSLGTIYTLPKVTFSDVLDPDVVSTVTITNPSGEPVVDVNGLTLKDVPTDVQYSFELNDYGQFIVTYYAKDSSDNPLNYSFACGVLSEDIPEIVIKSSYKTTIKLGENIIVPDYEIDYSGDHEKLMTYVSVRSPKGYIHNIAANANSFKPSYEGVYTVTIHVIDDAGNFDMFSYQVTVVK